VAKVKEALKREGMEKMSDEMTSQIFGRIEVHCLISAVRTTWPATRPAYSFLKFRAYPLYVLPSGFRLLDGDNPADPLVARERRNILPLRQRRCVRNENFS
jgi:hypothetical protein